MKAPALLAVMCNSIADILCLDVLCCCAMLQGHTHLLRLFLQRGVIVSIDVRTAAGATALHLAAAAGHLQAVQFLLESGATVDVCLNSSLATPLHCAAAGALIVPAATAAGSSGQQQQWYGDQLQLVDVASRRRSCPAAAGAAVAAVLMKAGAAAAEDHRGWLPLHWAVARGCLETTKLLLQQQQQRCKSISSSSLVNARTKVERWSALHIAVLIRNEAMVDLLLQQQGVHVHVLDAAGMAPAHYAAAVRMGTMCLVMLLTCSRRSKHSKVQPSTTAEPDGQAAASSSLDVFSSLEAREILMHLAVAAGDRELVSYLLQAGGRFRVLPTCIHNQPIYTVRYSADSIATGVCTVTTYVYQCCEPRGCIALHHS